MELLATQLSKPGSTPQVDWERLPYLKNDKMAREIGNRKSAFIDQTKLFVEIEENSLH